MNQYHYLSWAVGDYYVQYSDLFSTSSLSSDVILQAGKDLHALTKEKMLKLCMSQIQVAKVKPSCFLDSSDVIWNRYFLPLIVQDGL